MTARQHTICNRPIAHVAVVVPANNEAATVAAALESIDRAQHRLRGEVTSTVVVVLDACTDDTHARVVERRRHGATRMATSSIVHVHERSAGAARAAGFARALQTSRARPEQIWLATTDADTVVPSDWLCAQLELADRGADAFAGVVHLGDDAPHPLRMRFSAGYTLRTDGSHDHVHGANMGMRASSYLAAGGWAPIDTGEDHDLWRRLGQVGNCVSSTSVSVRTSARLAGRAPAGFAADLLAIVATEDVA